MGNIIFEPLALAVTVVYPSYQTYKCLEHADKHDSRQWLTYWLAFACLFVIDHLFGWILSWVPLYWTCKVLFLFFCAYLNGATVLYSRYLKPYLAEKEARIDRELGKGQHFVASKLKGWLVGTTKEAAEEHPELLSGFSGELESGFVGLDDVLPK